MLNVVYWTRGADFADMAVGSAESMKQVYKGARVFVYADSLHSQFKSSAIDQVFVLPILNDMPSMVANLHAQVHFCCSGNFDQTTLFCDADVLAVQPAPLELEGDNAPTWDLLVTQREFIGVDQDGKPVVGVAEEMPYNYGVIFANPGCGSREAFIWMRERVAKMSGPLQGWYGNQWALRELVGGRHDEPTPRVLERQAPFGKVMCRVEHCDQWNFTPEKPDEDIGQVYFLHLKGEHRKAMFDAYRKAVAA